MTGGPGTLLRLPPDLHASLVRAAAGVSFNQFCISPAGGAGRDVSREFEGRVVGAW